MRTTESVLKIQKGIVDKYNENDVYNSSAMSLMDVDGMSSAISQMDTNDTLRHHPDNDTMVILENVEIEMGSRKNTALYMNDMNQLLANYKDTFHSLTKLRKHSPIDTDTEPDIDIQPANKSRLCRGTGTSVLLWILLTYSVLCSTYFLFCVFFRSKNLPFLPDSEQSMNALAPIFIPTASPTIAIEKVEMVSTEPTLEPTLEPTKAPLIVDRYFVGDYKVSAQLQSHGNWLLCDGTLYNVSDYEELFGVIGYVFTAKLNDVSIYDETLFAVPDSRGKVIGIYDATKHLFGDVIGADWINLTRSNLPSQSHYLLKHLNVDLESIDSNNMSRNVSNVTLDHGTEYIVYGGIDEETNGVKSSRPFSSYQPTIFMGNAFVYS